MQIDRRQILKLGASATLSLTGAGAAWAQPAGRVVRIVAGFPAGSAADILARLIGQWLSERLEYSFVVENKPGAGSNIATEAVVNAVPDGNTLLLMTSANVINASLYPKLNFNFVRDVAPVASLTRGPLVLLVNPSFPARTVPEFVAYAKANPRKLNIASSGNGTAAHVCGELFKMMTGTDMVHVPYRGSPPAIADLVGGQTHALFDPMASVIEFIKAGKLRALAVTTAGRWDGLSDVPAIGEFVPGFEASLLLGLAAPRGTPPDLIGRLNREINAGLSDPKISARLAALGSAPLVLSPNDFGTLIADETEKWAKVVRASGAKPD